MSFNKERTNSRCQAASLFVRVSVKKTIRIVEVKMITSLHKQIRGIKDISNRS